MHLLTVPNCTVRVVQMQLLFTSYVNKIGLTNKRSLLFFFVTSKCFDFTGFHLFPSSIKMKLVLGVNLVKRLKQYREDLVLAFVHNFDISI